MTEYFEMSIQNSPKIGDTLFLLHREVVVIKVYGTSLTGGRSDPLNRI